MYDAFRQNLDVARQSAGIVAELGLEREGYALLTVHRAENVDEPANLRSILDGVDRSGWKTVFPVHPRTRAALAANGPPLPANLVVIDPVGYLEMLALEQDAAVIVTDSGGVQKEAYFAGRPCVTVRDSTEWTETVEAGWNVLVGRDVQAMSTAIREFRPGGQRPELFGDGNAAERVVEALSP
jgi:UDP-N-acetylglucosamine 2-epimerase